MKKFLTRLIIFVIPIIILVNIPKIIPFTFHDDLNRKINTLIDKNNLPDIYIAGDSRAERQLIPRIFEERLNEKTVNIAVTSGDITRLYNALMKNNLIDPNRTLIISISSIETNDTVINKWGIPYASTVNISLINNLKLFGFDYLDMIHKRIRLMFNEFFHKDVMLSKGDDRIETKGFMGIDGDISNWDFKSINIHKDTLKVGWYIDAIHDGVRKQLFEKMVDKLSKTDMNIILFQPPVSPSWYNHTKSTYIDTIELDHSIFLKKLASLYSNVSVIDFYTNYDSVYRDSMFYNSIHFNKDGAVIFTNMLIDSLITRNLLNANNIKY